MNEKAKSFKDLLIWQKFHDLVMEVYRITLHFPKEELFALTSQIRRAAGSIPANIAEGFARKGIKDKLRFYNIAMGSLNEVNYFLFLSSELNDAETEESQKRVEEIGRMLNSYSKSIQD